MPDWYRNQIWNSEVERVFEEKLHRAKEHKKGQYLRVQAYTLAESYPEVALKLLDRYFEIPGDFFRAQAHFDRASSYLALERVDDALQSYEDALDTERTFPNVRTQARIEYPFIIAVRNLQTHYPRAIEVLDMSSPESLSFPNQRFRWHAAHALIASDLNDLAQAKIQAEKSLGAAAERHSGFRYHPTLGLVTGEYSGIVERLSSICRQ